MCGREIRTIQCLLFSAHQDYYQELFPEKKSLSPDLLARASISLVLLDITKNAHKSSVGMIFNLFVATMEYNLFKNDACQKRLYNFSSTSNSLARIQHVSLTFHINYVR